MKNLFIALVALVLVAFGAAGCGKSDAEKPESKADSPASQPAGKADAKKGPASAPADKKAGGAVTVEQFANQAPTNVCVWLDTCKNEEVTFGVQSTMMLLVAFGGMAKPELAKEIEEKLAPLKAAKDEKRTKLKKEECNALTSVGAKIIGFDEAALKKSVAAKKVKFDAAKAPACLKALKGEGLAACKEEKKLEKEPGMAEMEKMMKPYEKALEAHLKPCEDVLVGMVDAGGVCAEDYECKGKAQCKGKGAERKCAADKAPPGAPAPGDKAPAPSK